MHKAEFGYVEVGSSVEFVGVAAFQSLEIFSKSSYRLMFSTYGSVWNTLHFTFCLKYAGIGKQNMKSGRKILHYFDNKVGISA